MRPRLASRPRVSRSSTVARVRAVLGQRRARDSAIATLRRTFWFRSRPRLVIAIDDMSVMAAQSQLSSGVGAVCRVRFAVVLVLMIGAPSAAASAGGQELTDVSSPARVTLGPVGLTPGLAIHTMGVDNNVFNEAEDPQRDFTGTIAPSVDGTMQMGRVAARLKSEASFIYYQKYASQRAFNIAEDLTVAARLHRLTPFARLQYVNARERPSIEIDSRVRRRELKLGGGVQVAVGPTFSVQLGGISFKLGTRGLDLRRV